MSVEAAKRLYDEGKLTDKEFCTYALFMGTQEGQIYFRNSMDDVILEAPPPKGAWVHTYQAGRISIWRDIKAILTKVNALIKGIDYDRDNNYNRNH